MEHPSVQDSLKCTGVIAALALIALVLPFTYDLGTPLARGRFLFVHMFTIGAAVSLVVTAVLFVRHRKREVDA